MKLLPGGQEPDPRFTLANERTFLAWIRTSLALLAGGIAIEAFASNLLATAWTTYLASGLVTIALLVSAGSFFRWLSIERAMRQSSPLPFPLAVPLLAVSGAGIALVLSMVFLKPS